MPTYARRCASESAVEKRFGLGEMGDDKKVRYLEEGRLETERKRDK